MVVTPVTSPSPDHWKDIIPASRDLKVDGVDTFSRFWAVYGREAGYKNVWIARSMDIEAFLDAGVPIREGAPAAVPLTRIPAPEAVFVVSGARGNMDYHTGALRFTYSSPRTPTSVSRMGRRWMSVFRGHGCINFVGVCFMYGGWMYCFI